MTSRHYSLLILFVSFLFLSWKVESVPNTRTVVGGDTVHVSDPDDLVSSEDESKINSMLHSLRAKSDAMVVILKTIDNADENEFANELFNLWGIGNKQTNNGLLILVVEDSRTARIETGDGMEGIMPDVVCGKLISQKMLPAFRNGDYGTGLIEASKTLIDIIDKQEMSGVQETDTLLKTKEGTPFWTYILIYYLIISPFFAISVYINNWDKLKKARCKYKNRNATEKNAAYKDLAQTLPPPIQVIPIILITPLTIFILGALVYYKRKYSRLRLCPNCKKEMDKQMGIKRLNKLTDAQIFEEEILSQKYEIWLCHRCGEIYKEKEPDKHFYDYSSCAKCGTRAAKTIDTEELEKATNTSNGSIKISYECTFCKEKYVNVKATPKLYYSKSSFRSGYKSQTSNGSSSYSSTRSSSHSSRGSFGGGRSSGGGASKRW